MNNNSSILQLLKRYLSGDVGPRQEAELERHAQSDEFLGEALEGLRSQPEEDHEAAVTRMRRNLPRDEKAVRPIGWYRLAAAASVLLLIGAALFMLPTWLDSAQETTAMKEAQPESVEEIVAFEDRVNGDDLEADIEIEAIAPAPQAVEKDQPLKKKAAQKKEVASSPTPPPPAPKSTFTTPSAEPVPPVVATAPVASAPISSKRSNERAAVPEPYDADILPQSYRAEAADEIVEEVAEDEPIAIAPPPVIGNRFDNSAALPAGFRKISGYVTDENDRPITDANVVLPGQPLGEKTNQEGFFELIGDNTIRQINVMHPDYQAAEISLPSGEKEVQINLETNREESEAKDDWRFNGAISTYYPNRTASSAALKEGTTRQLRNAIITDKPANLGTGKVRVSFSVQEDGSLASFSLSGRSSDALQAYVRRYLLDNSQWELIRGEEPARVYLVFNFD